MAEQSGVFAIEFTDMETGETNQCQLWITRIGDRAVVDSAWLRPPTDEQMEALAKCTPNFTQELLGVRLELVGPPQDMPDREQAAAETRRFFGGGLG
jgi:hypothetical protein